MAGEVLMCVWEAGWSIKGRGVNLCKDTLKKILQQCRTEGLVKYSQEELDDTFLNAKVQFTDFKKYALLYLKPPAVCQTQFEDQMERSCLNLALSGARYKGLSSGQQFDQIWSLFVRLAHVGSYPPVVSGENVKWLLDGTMQKGTSLSRHNNFDTENEVTFREFLNLIRESGDQEFIECMFSWIVQEPIKVENIPCREKLDTDWSVWEKFKVVMCYGKLELYADRKSKKPEKVFYINSKSICTKVTPGWKVFSASKKLNNRIELFVVDKAANVIIQLALNTEHEVEEWQKDFRRNARAMVSGTKPMIQEIQRRPSNPDIGKKNRDSETNNQNKKDQGPSLNKEEIAEKVRTVFLGIDKDGNGLMDKDEFHTMINVLEIDIDDEQLDLIFGVIDMDGSGFVAFEEFFRYMMMVVGWNVSRAKNDEEDDMHIVKAFRKADNESRGILDFKEFVVFLISIGQADLIAPGITMFQECDTDGNGFLEYEQFRDIFIMLDINQTVMVSEKEKRAQLLLKNGLRKICHSADTSKITAFLEERWKKFAGLKRYDQHDNLVMSGSDLVKDYLPGSYKLSELSFFQPPVVLPKHIVAVNGTNWRSKRSGEKSGELTFTGAFDGVVPAIMATSQNLSYYNCCFANQSEQDYSLVYRHGVIDFDYSQKYLEEYVLAGMGGSGIEKHSFDHLDCPLEEDSGVMVLGKYVNDNTLHLSGFIIPKMHTVFIPANTVHSNDYLRGTWRTMLSDETDIDHVQFMRFEKGRKQHFHFTFDEV